MRGLGSSSAEPALIRLDPRQTDDSLWGVGLVDRGLVVMRYLGLTVLVLFAFGCQYGAIRPPIRTRTPRPDTPAKPRADTTARLPLPDLGSVAGRRICLDPGHGGRWTGAVAPHNALRESDVNLEVALRLRDLLEAAGAEVILTRESDEALDNERLSLDLAARSAVANRVGAAVLVSIHHNADIDPARQKNDLEVYYDRRDHGPSLDLAQCLTHALARWLRSDAEAKLLLPGNFRVLRDAEVPAVLLESSYLTCDRNAADLASGGAVDAEARAIAAGLALYFSLDPPRVSSVDVVPCGDDGVYQIRVACSSGWPIDTDSASIQLDTIPLPGECVGVDRGFVWTCVAPLPNGRHMLRAIARNMQGAAMHAAVPVVVARPATRMTVRQRPRLVRRGSGIELLFEATVRDSLDMPVADGAPVTLVETGQNCETSEGKARFYWRDDGTVSRFTFRADAAQATFSLEYGAERRQTLRCLDARTRDPVGETVALAGSEALASATREGWMAAPCDQGLLRLVRRGYETVQVGLADAHTEILLRPVEDGVLHGRRIVLDPAFGGRRPGAIGPTGLRASDVNLDVARRAAAWLRNAGADVRLTRVDDSEPSDLQRLALTDRFDSEVFVIVSFGMPRKQARLIDEGGHVRDQPERYVGHYPGSVNGQRLALALARAFGGLAVSPSAAYLVRQTPCPAVLCQPAAIRGEEEDVWRTVEARGEAAQAVYRGVLGYFGELPGDP